MKIEKKLSSLITSIFRIIILVTFVTFAGCSVQNKNCNAVKPCLKEIKIQINKSNIKEALSTYDKYKELTAKEDYCILLNIAVKVSKNLYAGKIPQANTKSFLDFVNAFYSKTGLPIISEKLGVKDVITQIEIQKKIIKFLCAEILYNVGYKSYMDRCVKYFKDSTPMIRGSVLVSIGYTKDKKYLKAVKESYYNDSVSYVRMYALKALGYMDFDNYKEDLTKALTTSNQLENTIAAGCLLSGGDKTALNVLEKSLDSKNELVVARALEGLTQAKIIINEEKVFKFLDKKGSILSFRAAQLIGKTENPKFIADLKRKLNNEEDKADKLTISMALLMLDDDSGLDYIKQGLYSDNVLNNIFASYSIIEYCKRHKLCNIR